MAQTTQTQFSLKYFGEEKGNGLIANENIEKDQLIFRDVNISGVNNSGKLSVLYSDYVKEKCANCFFAFTSDGMNKCVYQCKCGCFYLCGNCVESNSNNGILTRHKEWICEKFIAIPSYLRKGDTDYLRFFLQYFDYLQRSSHNNNNNSTEDDSNILLFGSNLCTNKKLQPIEYMQLSNHFAKLFMKTINGLSEITTEDEIVDMMCRIRCNSLGFPFDETATLGWTLSNQLSLLNHSCDPNCFIGFPPNDHSGDMCLLAKRNINKGEELSISYIDLQSPQFQSINNRREALRETFLFECNCVRCINEL